MLAREIAETTGLSLPLVAEKLELLERDQFPVNRHVSLDSLDAAQREQLIEALLIHETYFFRHPNQWHLLRSQLPPLVARLLASGKKSFYESEQGELSAFEPAPEPKKRRTKRDKL